MQIRHILIKDIKSSPLKPLNQAKPNLAGMVSSGWVPFKIVSDSPALNSRWLLKRFRCEFDLIIFLNGINWWKKYHRKPRNIC
jgi:hypothetical protein